MSSVFDNPIVKSKCQVFTPTSIVSRMLDDINYKNDLYGKKVLDHSCGDGQFLKEVVRRYICCCKAEGIPDDRICNGLSRDIWGVELDKNQFDKCLSALNIIAMEYEIENVKWQLINADSLKHPLTIRFDYIVGNPPYLSYWDLPITERDFIRNKYYSCKNGAYDYCFAFIEEALSLLKEDGVLTYIIPNSIFKTKAGKILRNKIKPYIRSIYDYKSEKVFTNALTSSAIIILDKSVSSDVLSYNDSTGNDSIVINKKDLKDTWIFKEKIEEGVKRERRFGDYFKVSSSVATQYNKAFVLVNWEEDGLWMKGPKGDRIERRAVSIAASPKGKILCQSEWIIFPYYYENGTRKRYTEDEFREALPLAYEYLLRSKEKLMRRDSDKKAMWFEYGRSQALDHLMRPKILISSVISSSVKVFNLATNQVPYSGMYIVPIKDLSIDDGIQILRSKDFHKYVESIGVNINGSSLRITAENICNYCW